MWKFELVKVFLPLLFAFVTSGSDANLQATQKGNAEEFNLTRRNFDAGCSKIFTNEEVLIQSPGYPSGYPANSDCYYIFKGPVCPTYFNFQFLDFNLASSLGCSKDRLEIHDTDAVCGSTSGIKSYFSKNGVLQARFTSDVETSGRGFKILVTRLACGINPETTPSDPDIAWEMTPKRNDLVPPQKPQIPEGSNLPFCCANAYNSKQFFLSSPGFPNSNNNPGECAYHIYRANPNVCRLRIHFLFFWSGEQDGNLGCNNGYLQVDGKFICGCRIGLKLISAFDSRWGNAPKVLRFKNSGFPQSMFSGFVLEVIQDECPKRIAPTDNSAAKSQFYFDQINRIAWPTNNVNQNVIERALLVKENTEILDDDINGNPEVVRHVYFFEAPESYDYGYTFVKEPREIEETNYIDTSGLKALLPDGYDNNQCRAWGGLQWSMLAQQTLWHQMPQCNGFANKPINQQCEQANYVKGYVQSPGYPKYYPGNLNLCYRFGRHPGYCGMRVKFVDFHVEDSFECRKDYVMLGGRYRYCGQSLYNTVLTFDLRNNPYEDIYFITDAYSCGRGFKAIYEQIPCDNIEVPVNPPNPVYPTRPTTLRPPPIAPPPNPQTPCSRDIQDEVFIIEVYGHNQPRCVFNIHKRHPGVCRLSLTFLNFDLPCGSEQLLIHNKRYCGRINGQTLNINFNHYQVPIIYERSTTNPAITGLRFRLRGSQMSNGCDPYEYPSVPAERLIDTSNDTNKQLVINLNTGETFENNIGIVSERKYDSDFCGLILNATEDTVASSICNFLTERSISNKCISITPTLMYVPYNSEETKNYNSLVNELDLQDFDRIEKVKVSEISCDQISRIIKN